MMTKEELKRYFNGRGIPEIWAFPGFPNYDSVHYDNIKDAIQIKYEHREMLKDIIWNTGCFRTNNGILSDGSVIVFDDHVEVYPRDETIPPASSNDQTSIGEKLKIAHDAFKAMPRVKGMPEHVRFFASEHSDDWKNSYLKGKLDDCVAYIKSIGFEWADELCGIVYPPQSQSDNKKADSDKAAPKKSNVVLNASIKELKNTKASDKISITVDGVDIQLTTQQVRDYIAAREAIEHKTESPKEPIGLLTAGKRDFKIKPISGLIDVDFVWSVVNRDTFDQVCGELNIREKERILRTIDRELKFALTRDDGKRWIHPNEQKFDIEEIGKRGTIYLRSQSIRFVILKLGHRHRFRIFDINATIDAINKWTDEEYAKFDQQQAKVTTKTSKGDVKVEVEPVPNAEKKDEPKKKEEPIEPEIVSEPKANTAA